MSTPRKCYVVERHDPELAEMSLERVFAAQTAAWKYVNDALLLENKELDLEIIESPTVGNTYYFIQDKDDRELVGFYITEVEYHE